MIIKCSSGFPVCYVWQTFAMLPCIMYDRRSQCCHALCMTDVRNVAMHYVWQTFAMLPCIMYDRRSQCCHALCMTDVRNVAMHYVWQAFAMLQTLIDVKGEIGRKQVRQNNQDIYIWYELVIKYRKIKYNL